MTAVTSTPTVARFRRIPAETILLAAVIIMVVAGVLIVFDASFPLSMESQHIGNDPLYFGKQQAQGLIGGLVCMLIAIRVGYKRLRPWAGTLMVAGLTLLAMVWVPHVGVAVLHGRRWIHLLIVFQASEIAKITLMVFVAAKLANDRHSPRSLSTRMSAALAAAGMYLALIVLEPDLGTAIVLALAFLTMFFAAGAKSRQIGIIIGFAAVLFFLKGGLKPGQMSRLTVFTQQGRIEAGDGYQSFHSKLAIGSGRITGVGWGSGREKYYLPQANSDYIFATVGEEFGLIGTSVMLLLFFVVTWCGLTIARQAEDQFGRLLAVGLTAIISWQALINIAVVTVSIPATGVPLPFISNGLTSLIMTLVSVGLLVNIAQESRGVRIGPVTGSAY